MKLGLCNIGTIIKIGCSFDTSFRGLSAPMNGMFDKAMEAGAIRYEEGKLIG